MKDNITWAEGLSSSFESVGLSAHWDISSRSKSSSFSRGINSVPKNNKYKKKTGKQLKLKKSQFIFNENN